MKKILITGANGTIGSVLKKGLSNDYEVTSIDIKGSSDILKIDLTAYEALKKVLKGHDVIIHLAYTEDLDDKNIKMAKNLFNAAMETNPHPTLIIASSIHVVGGYIDWNKPPYCFIAKREFDKIKKYPRLININAPVFPNSLYGATKAYIEALGKYYSRKGLKVVMIRFGGANPKDVITDEIGYHCIWLSHKDCINLINHCIEAKDLPDYSVFFAVSNNKYKLHDTSQTEKVLGFKFKDNAGE